MAILNNTTIKGGLTVSGDTTLNSKLYLNGVIDSSNNSLLPIADVINNHQRQIDSLRSPAIATAQLNITGGNIKFWKIGQLVYARCTAAFVPKAGTQSLGTIPAGYRPIDTVSAAVNGTSNWTVNNWLSVYFYADGRCLYATYGTSAATEVYFSCFYLTS